MLDNAVVRKHIKATFGEVVRVYDSKFFEELSLKGISPFTGSSVEAKRRSKQRLIKSGILPEQSVEQGGGRYSYWETESAEEITERAALSFKLRGQGLRWKAIVGNLIVLPIIEKVNALPQPPIELTKLSPSEIRSMDWSPIVESLNWIFGTYGITHDSFGNLRESEKFEAFFYIQAVLQWMLRDKLSSSAILAELRKEVRQGSARRSGYFELEAFLRDRFGSAIGDSKREKALKGAKGLFVLSAVGERGLEPREVSDTLEEALKSAGIPSVGRVIELYVRVLNVTRIRIERNQFDVKVLIRDFKQILDTQDV